MQKQAPSPGRIAIMAVFALSCFGLLLFLWNAFGGPSPLQAQGYRFQVGFPEATQLSQQADVRISGVPVGKVVALDRSADRSLATIEMRPQYAPVRMDARAILRLKTLLGETYVELTPGSARARAVPEGGRLPDARVAPTTELDEVLRAFDKPTRRSYKAWFTGWAAAIQGRGRDLNDVIGNFGPVARDGGDLLSILDGQRHALSTLVRDTGRTFGALGRQEGATRTLIRSGDRVFAATTRRDADLQRTLEIVPSFLRELQPTLRAVQATSADAAPVLRDLKPAAPLLRPVLRDTIAVAPVVRTLFRELDPVITLSRTALPAATRTLRATLPLMGVLDPLARELDPIAAYLGDHEREVVQMFANVASATQATAPGGTDGRPVHYLRAVVPVVNELLVEDRQRSGLNRHNPYLAAGAYEKLATGYEAIDCGNAANAGPVLRFGGAPPCKVQDPPEVSGKRLRFPHLERLPPAR
jgi:virulence factor Mce-like protein